MRAPTRLSPVSRAPSVSIGTSDFAARSGNWPDASVCTYAVISASFGSGTCSAAACGLSTTRPFRSCSPSLISTVTMFDCAMAGSLAQPSTLTVLAANPPPSCSASPRGTTNSANSITTAMRRGVAWRRLRPARRPRRPDRLQVERAQQVAIDQLQRRARLAQQRLRVGFAAERLLEPVAPVLGAARRAHAAAAVVAQHDVVAGEHHLVEKRRQREQAAGRRHDVEDVAVEEELRGGSGAEQIAHLRRPAGQLGHWLSFARASAASGGGSVSRSSIAP